MALTFYARICGWTLARAHARSGDPIAIAEVPGRRATRSIDRSPTSPTRYADQNERDYQAFLSAAKGGKIPVVEGV